MADEQNVAANAGGDQGAAPATGDLDTKPAASALAAAADDTAAAAAPGAASATPENWRELLSGGDEKLGKLIGRYTTPQNVARALAEARARISAGQMAQSLPEDAAPEEIAAYRKAMGVPEAPDGYGFQFPQEAGATEADTAVLGAFQQFMHERHVPPGAAKAAFDFYLKNWTDGRAAREEAAQQATLEQMAQLRAAFPARELQRNYRIADEFAQQHFTEHDELEAFNEVMTARLPNGVMVKDYAPFMKGLFKAARSQADEEALIGGDGGGGGKSIDEEKAELVRKSATKPLTAAEDKRLDELIAAQMKREQRGRAA